MSRIRILIADDHEIVRQGLRAALASEPDMTVVGEAQSGRQALTLAQEQEPDVVLLDIKLGDMDGSEVCAQILRLRPRTTVIMLTNYSHDVLVFQSLAAGAKCYLLKDVGLGELRGTIRTAFRGGTVLDPRVATQVISKAMQRGAKAPLDGIENKSAGLLSATELTTIQHLSRGLTNKEIGERLHLSAHTIKDRLEKIAATLGVRSRTEIVAEAFRRGLI
jgi:two-component system, NarL family, response regulator LiaR